MAVGLGLLLGCGGDDDGDGDETTEVGRFEGLFDDFATGFNYPFDMRSRLATSILTTTTTPRRRVRTTCSLRARSWWRVTGCPRSCSWTIPPRDDHRSVSTPLFDGTAAGLRGATAVAMTPDRHAWVAFEQGGEGDVGGIVVLSPQGDEVMVFGADEGSDAFHNPGGLCFGGPGAEDGSVRMFMINLGDGSAWRIDAGDTAGADAHFTRVGGGLATGSPGRPGSPGNEITSSSDLPQGGARGCAYRHLYVADAQNARVARFDDPDGDDERDAVALEDTPSELVTYPTGVTVNATGHLVVISYHNAHAFVTLELPGGGFLDNGLHDLNVNSGNYGVAVAADTIWFSRANNKNGSLRAITPDHEHAPTTYEPFPTQ